MLQLFALVYLLGVATSQPVIVDIVDSGCPLDPPFLVNGRYKRVEFEDEVTTACVEYSCATGYDLVGERYNFCRNGSWVHSDPPTCRRIACPPPPVPVNGVAIPRVPYATSPIRYTCNQPLLLEGVRFNYCRNGMWWRTDPPRCVLRSVFDMCRRIRCVLNAVCSEGVCRCRRGYSGHGRRSCHRMCEEAPMKPNAVAKPLEEAYHHKTTIDYECADGYKLVDNSPTLFRCYFGRFRQVTIRGTPSCNVSLCRDPKAPESGGTVPVNDHTVTWNDGDIVEYICNPGFRLVGRRRAVCKKSDSLLETPVCLDTCIPEPFPNTDYFPIQGTYNPNDRITYRCDRGYEPVSGFDAVKTCRNGFFVGDSPDCMLVCDPPEAPENGLVANNRSVWFVGSVVRYACQPGFELRGDRTTLCVNATSFDVTPTCRRPLVSCAPPVAPANGQIQPSDRTAWLSGDVVTFSCDENYLLMGDTSATCRQDGTFQPVTLRCTVICRPPTPPLNGSILPTNQSQWIEGDGVMYSCNAGFRLVGSENVTCTNRTSFVNVTSCMAIPCDPPTAPANGYITGLNMTTWVSGDVAMFSCNDNFTLIGEANATCRDDGMFEMATTTCAVICIPPTPPLNGAIFPTNQSQWIEGDDVMYRCNAGFRLVGSENVTCTIRTSFVNVTSCMAIPCDSPTAPTNGFISGIANMTTWVIGDVAIFSCNDNFTLIGEANTTCRDDGMFEMTTTTCAVICIPPMAPLNGAIFPNNQSQFIEGDGVRYLCDAGFLLVGSENVTCSNRTSFLHPPSCMVICSPPSSPPNGAILPTNQSQWIEGDSVTYTCNAGFLLVGSESETCTNRSSFVQTPSCIIICLPPTPPQHGTVSPVNQSQWIEEDDVIYSCDAGFLLVGSESVTCTNRTSFVQTPSCLVLCDPPIPPLNGAISPTTKSQWIEGDDVMYSCNPGFQLIGTENVTCTNRTSFVNVTSCMEFESSAFMGCPEPSVPANGRIEPANLSTWRSGDVVLYTCDDGFFLVGSNASTCGEDGSFDEDPPVCEEMPVTCPPPHAPTGGRLEPTNQTTWGVGDVVMYFCTGQFTLLGSSNATCMDDGVFDNLTPECIEDLLSIIEPVVPPGCSRPAAPTNGGIEPTNQTMWESGDVITYVCNVNFAMTGLRRSTCLDNGTFDNPPPTCTATCLPPIPPQGGVIEPADVDVFLEGVTIRYRCNDGFILIGQNVGVCSPDHTFRPIRPLCIDDLTSIIEAEIPSGCTEPSTLSNGSFEPTNQETWETGDIVTYMCDVNFTLVGAINASCQEDGTFDNSPPTCAAICPPPNPPEGGGIEPPNQEFFNIGDQVQFSCHNDTMLIGAEIGVCSSDHSFQPGPPFCLDVAESSGEEDTAG